MQRDEDLEIHKGTQIGLRYIYNNLGLIGFQESYQKVFVNNIDNLS